MAHKVYISASTQKANIGVGQYGTEQDRMMHLSDMVKYYLDKQDGKFEVFRNKPGWTLGQTVINANNSNIVLFIDNHTNAGPAAAWGTEVFYHGPNKGEGYKMAQILYDEVAPLSPGKDRGVLDDHTLYKEGLYILRKTTMPATLIEHIFHTNLTEAVHYIANISKYVKAEAKAICKYFGVTFIDPDVQTPIIDLTAKLVNEMMRDGLVTDYSSWYNVLYGKASANPEYLKIAFTRATDKIK